MFPCLSFQKIKCPTIQTLEQMYYKWTNASANTKLPIISNLNIPQALNLIPYIIGYDLSRTDRLRSYIKVILIPLIIQKTVSKENRDLLKPYIMDYELIFEQILYPDRKTVKKYYNNRNPNRFDLGKYPLSDLLFKFITNCFQLYSRMKNTETEEKQENNDLEHLGSFDIFSELGKKILALKENKEKY